jgi:apolipoprotein D and lipocalin family protein
MRFARSGVAALASLVALLFVATTIGVGSDNEGEPAVMTVAAVDLNRYAGLWYEIARIPNRFQKDCSSGTTAEYTLREDGRIAVVNRCTKEDGDEIVAEGVAKIEDATSNAKLKVSFVSFLGWRPFWGDYWILGLEDSYQWAVVGAPDRKYGWVLARSPELDEGVLEEVFAILERNGYTRDAFVMSGE